MTENNYQHSHYTVWIHVDPWFDDQQSLVDVIISISSSTKVRSPLVIHTFTPGAERNAWPVTGRIGASPATALSRPSAGFEPWTMNHEPWTLADSLRELRWRAMAGNSVAGAEVVISVGVSRSTFNIRLNVGDSRNAIRRTIHDDRERSSRNDPLFVERWLHG